MRLLVLLNLALLNVAACIQAKALPPADIPNAIHPPACATRPAVKDGQIVVLDCHGNIVPAKPTDDAPLPLDLSSAPNPAANTDAYNAATQKLALNTVEFNLWTNEYTKSLYVWQARASIAIFFIVIGLVLTGIYFAWLQFQTTLHLARTLPAVAPPLAVPVAAMPVQTPADVPAAPLPPGPDRTEFRIGKDGIVIQSSFVGLIILAMSMGFFILYLKYVYPISRSSAAPPTATQTQDQSH